MELHCCRGSSHCLVAAARMAARMAASSGAVVIGAVRLWLRLWLWLRSGELTRGAILKCSGGERPAARAIERYCG